LAWPATWVAKIPLRQSHQTGRFILLLQCGDVMSQISRR
jgi:hypothetical protein